MVLWRTTRTYREFLWRSSRLIKQSFHHHLWHLPYIEVFVCHKQRVEVSHLNLSIERSWVPFRCWVSLFLTGFTSDTTSCDYHYKSILKSRRRSARGYEERGQNTSWKAEWRWWCLVRVKVGEGSFQWKLTHCLRIKWLATTLSAALMRKWPEQ